VNYRKHLEPVYTPDNRPIIERIILRVAGALTATGRPAFQVLLLGVIVVFACFYVIERAIGIALRLLKVLGGLFIRRRRKITVALEGLIVFTSLAGVMFWFFILRGLPDPKELTTRNLEATTKIYDRNGVLLYKIYKNKNRSPIKLTEIPEEVKSATLAAEDAEFYEHPGFSIRGIARAAIKYIKEDKITGGSTITQQLVKNALLSPEKTLKRKLREIFLAVEVERMYSKDQILEMYLNEVAYGGTAYGIEEAARIYFDKQVGELNLAEAALLAGLPKSPTRYSPFGSNPETARMRQREVLDLMVKDNLISYVQAEKAKLTELNFAQNKIDIKAPHFVMYVREMLVEKYGEDVVEKGGLEVVTTLDYSIQKKVEEIVRDEVDKAKAYHVGNGAALVINPTNGEVLAMVGSKDYFDNTNDGNVNVLTRLRQPGSSIKIVNYAYALSHGYTAASILKDSPITFNVAGSPPYSPKNYDGRFRGNLSLRSAFAESRNVPAVKVLASYGVNKMVELGTNMGISSWKDPTDYGLSLTLGGGDVKLIDLARAYATIANYGKRPRLVSIKTISDYKQRRIYSAEEEEQTQIVDPRVAYILVDILRDNNARTPAFGANNALVIPGHAEVAVKTGTSNNMRDNVTVGFTQNFLAAAWVGNNDNSPMSRIASGVTGAAPIWNRIMNTLLEGQSNHPWEVPQGLVQRDICSLTGTLPCSGCPTKKEWFLEENQPKTACSPELFKKREAEKPEGRIL
jgi:1A family penicillin-binding protein